MTEKAEITFPVLSGGELTAEDVALEWLGYLAPRTREQYESELRVLAGFLGVDVYEAVGMVFRSKADANRIAFAWRASMVENEMAPRTINLRLTVLRVLLRFARILGVVDFGIEVRGFKVHRDPEAETITWEEYQSRLPAATARERVWLMLMGNHGLRRSEVCDFQGRHILERGTALSVKRKGKAVRSRVALVEPEAEALGAWLAERSPGRRLPREEWLFPGYKGRCVNVRTVYRACRRVMGVHPHVLRHMCVTRALDATDGDVRAVSKLANHADVRTTMIYDDEQRDLALEVARRMLEGS